MLKKNLGILIKMNQTNLAGKNCVITGATGGIGKNLSELLASEGCNLFLISRNEANLNQLKTSLGIRFDVKIFTLSADLSISKNFPKVISEIRNHFKNIDVLINSAGIFDIKSLSDSSLEFFDKSFTLNVTAPFYFSKYLSPDMIQQKWGRIVNIGSSSSYSGFSNSSVYCTTKHALLGLSRSLHSELKKSNVRCYCISPSSTRTDMGKISSDQNFETFLDPMEVAKAIVFAISFDENLVMDEIRLNRMNIE